MTGSELRCTCYVTAYVWWTQLANRWLKLRVEMHGKNGARFNQANDSGLVVFAKKKGLDRRLSLTELFILKTFFFFRVYLLLPKLQLPLRRSYLHKICTSAVHIIFYVSFLSPAKLNSTNWPAPNIWVFIAQMVVHCSANAEAMGSMKSRNFFFGFIHICNCLKY